MSTFLVTWNPEVFDWDAVRNSRGRPAAIKRTAVGQRSQGGWSTGVRKYGISPEDRVFMLRQGPEPRGIVASGWFTSAVYPVPHFNGKTGEVANHAEISWDVVLNDRDVLPLDLLKSKIKGVWWEPAGGGVALKSPADADLERLWASHTRRTITKVPTVSKVTQVKKAQKWQADPIKRRLVEDYAQDLLEKHYRKKKWEVEDTRRGNPFDAIATKGKQIRYLEAKGTETDGASVLVTSGEVKFARANPGGCVMGIVSGILFNPDDTLDPSSGTLATHDWDPDGGVLKATAFTWAPPAAKP